MNAFIFLQVVNMFNVTFSLSETKQSETSCPFTVQYTSEVNGPIGNLNGALANDYARSRQTHIHVNFFIFYTYFRMCKIETEFQFFCKCLVLHC